MLITITVSSYSFISGVSNRPGRMDTTRMPKRPSARASGSVIPEIPAMAQE